ncbi:MAG TPA: M4 family metallopeptidase [Kofleriaceae bacterium]|nr:M4 family metallopeptidase [Kofleriaceae bacterium]
MNARGLIGAMIGFAAGCGVTGGEADDPSADLRVERIETAGDGLPYFVRGELGRIAAPIADVARAHEALDGVLPAIADTLGVPAASLVATRTERDEIGMTHVRLAQQKNGLRVVGGDVVLHIGADGTVRSVNSTARDRALTATPSLAAADAARLAVQATEDAVDAPRSELTYVVSNTDGELYLAWEVEVKGQGGALVDDLVYVDALTGRVVDRHPQIFTVKNRTVRNGNGGAFPVANAPVIGTEGTPPTDPVALAAYTNTGLTYDCYKALYNRDSYNNAGATLTSQVHVVFATGPTTTSPNNAVWSAQDQMMAYGDGDGVNMKQLAYALDVTSHELTHAVTSSTANLVYQNESGALNEGMSDIMGAVCEAWRDKAVSANTWLVGEEIWTPATAGDALRYMASPTRDGQSPDYYPERYTGTQDNGGVHLNSGLANLAFYLLSTGGKHPRAKTALTVPAVGIEKAGAIFQRALTQGYFTANTNFAQARTGSEQAAQDLYPGTCAKSAVSLAWATVGVGGPAPTDAVPPTVAIASPANGARVASGFQVQVNTTDDQCINKVELLIDGTVAQTLTAAPFNFTTDASLASGSHMIEVKSYDAFNQSTASAMITVGGGGNGNGNGNGGNNQGSENDVTGGCATGGGATGTLALLLAAAFALRPRRARR